MKRALDAQDQDAGDEKRQKCSTRWATPKKEQRSGNGVVTVREKASFKLDATTPAIQRFQPRQEVSSTPYLQSLRNLTFEALVNKELRPKLKDYVEKKFLLSPAANTWAEECESVFGLLFVAMHCPSRTTQHFVREVVLEFIGRWVTDMEVATLKSLPLLFTLDKKYASFSALVLLVANYFPEEHEAKGIAECLTWDSLWYPNHNPPQYLLNCLGHEHGIDCLKKILFVSFMNLRSLPFEMYLQSNDHEDVLVGFFTASKLYKEGNYEKALACAGAIHASECSQALQGWVLWLMGLSLVKLQKPSLALDKFKTAIDRSPACAPVLFNVWQVYHQKQDVSIELLTLKALALHEQRLPNQKVLTNAILNLHHPYPEDLTCRVLFLLAARYLQEKLYEESCSTFTQLLLKRENDVVPSNCCQTLFRPEDEVPELPSREGIIILQAFALFQKEDYQATIEIVDQLNCQDCHFADYYKSSDSVKMMHYLTLGAWLLKMEALMESGRIDEGLKEGMSLCINTSWIRGEMTLSDEWNLCIFLLKTVIHFAVSELQRRKGFEKGLSYRRYGLQNLKLLSEEESSPEWQNQSLSYKLLLNNVYVILREKLNAYSSRSSD